MVEEGLSNVMELERDEEQTDSSDHLIAFLHFLHDIPSFKIAYSLPWGSLDLLEIIDTEL